MKKRIVIEEVWGNVSKYPGFSVVPVRVLDGDVLIGDEFVLEGSSGPNAAPAVKIIKIVCYDQEVDILSTGWTGALIFSNRPFPYVKTQVLTSV